MKSKQLLMKMISKFWLKKEVLKMFQIRTNKPVDNKFYITKSKGGYSTCIEGKPTDKYCNVLANCVGYACGRFNEIIGSMKYPSLNCNAENFIERAKKLGLKISDVPVLGGIMVWQKGKTLSGNDGAGHVAIVEKIIDSNTIYTSESGYNSKAFWNSTRKNTNGRWGIGSAYVFRGCIVNPSVKVEEVSEKVNKYKIGDVVTINCVYISSTSTKKIRPAITKGKITRIIKGARNPYLLENGNIGWINDECVVSNITSESSVIHVVKKGDTLVKIANKYNTTWRKIYNNNKNVIGSNPNLIKPGQKLVIKK